MNFKNDNHGNGEKILLAVLPLWEKLIPPLGISCLKEFLVCRGFNVKTADGNAEETLKATFDTYLNTLQEAIPENNRSNFYNISNDVVPQHMMAHFNHEDEKKYVELVKTIIFNTFFCSVNDDLVRCLNEILDSYYHQLETYWLDLLEKETPTIVGLSVYSSTLPSSLFVLSKTKEKYPHIKTVIGGGAFTNQLALDSPNLEFFLEQTRDYVDKIIIGEGEMLFFKYLKGELPESQRVYTLKDIDRELVDLSSVGVPHFGDYNLTYYKHLAAYGSRSCPLNCSFCSETVTWGKYRKKSASKIVKELIKLYELHGSQLFLMCDSLLNPIVTPLAKELLEEDISIYWDGYLRADKAVCNTENTLLWRRGGFYRARLGLESGS
ncbi:MAG: hypothetical protein GY757_22035, partial [bacterium]|nr:hypothetical protein [bacterium]